MREKKLVVRPTSDVRPFALCPFTEIGGRVQQQRLTRRRRRRRRRDLYQAGIDEARARPPALARVRLIGHLTGLGRSSFPFPPSVPPLPEERRFEGAWTVGKMIALRRRKIGNGSLRCLLMNASWSDAVKSCVCLRCIQCHLVADMSLDAPKKSKKEEIDRVVDIA